MVLSYQHRPPGTPVPEPGPRLRPWDDSSPYHINRPLRGPRGRAHLPLLKKPITFRNVPELSEITLSILVKEAQEDSAFLHVAGMILQAITTQRATVNLAKVSSAAGQRAAFAQRTGKAIAVSTRLKGEAMWHFLSTLETVVLPKLKEWKGMAGKSGDGSGNLQLGLSAETVGSWPEVAINYDS